MREKTNVQTMSKVTTLVKSFWQKRLCFERDIFRSTLNFIKPDFKKFNVQAKSQLLCKGNK